MDAKVIHDIISKLDDFFFLEQPTPEEVENAQNDLGLNFAEDYKIYVSMAGAICGGGIELTGITSHDRLNVVKVTQREKFINPLIPDDMYVVEVVGIDGMVVLQDSEGTIYTAQPNLSPKKLFNSLIEYIQNVARFSPREDARKGFYYELCDEFGQDLVERMENGLVPLSSNYEMIHLHHMGLAQNLVTELTPIVELKESYYFDEERRRVFFGGFDGGNGYDRISCIRQKQDHWYERSKTINYS